MEYAKLIVFFLFLDIHSIHCQTPSPPNFISNCSFVSNTYTSNSSVANQFTFLNRTSIVLTASYAFVSSSTYNLGLIYPFATNNYLVPFPLWLNCSSMIESCLLERIAGSRLSTRDGELINVPSSLINFTFAFNQRVFYLGEGQYQLSNCAFDNGRSKTDNQTKFSIQIRYEKSSGASCNPLIDTCGSSNLTSCSSTTSTCTCLSSNSLVSYLNSSFCADTLNTSGCTIFPTRCITWCNASSNDLCICPSDTLRVPRGNNYICELPVDAINCSLNDSIRRCPLGQQCFNDQCKNEIITTIRPSTTTTVTTNNNPSIDSNGTDERLRIALGVIAGLLGTSLIILFSVFCWLRHRQKQARINAEKSLSPSSSSMTSSIYISPIQQRQDQHLRKSPSNNHRFSPIYRTNSFRQAILSGQQKINPYFIERVSTKPDHFSFTQEDFTHTSDYPYPNQNIYQTIIHPSSSSILTHSV